MQCIFNRFCILLVLNYYFLNSFNMLMLEIKFKK